jgi:NhaP-type Na+/H+ or K+/H+ antiporter
VLGQQLPSILADIEEYPVWVVLLYAALVYATVVVVRFAWFFTTPYFHPVFDRFLHSRYLRAHWQERLVMSWSGMRGAVSLAAALALPLSTDAGDPRGAWSGAEALPRCGGTCTLGRTRASAARSQRGGEGE